MIAIVLGPPFGHLLIAAVFGVCILAAKAITKEND